ALLAAGAGGPAVRFIGNVEGRDVMSDAVDVVVTDGFTGNVTLKALEGGLRFMVNAVLAVLTGSPEVEQAAAIILPEIDVVVTDGFTGNVTLKALEGGLRFMVNAVLAVLTGSPEVEQAAAIILP